MVLEGAVGHGPMEGGAIKGHAVDWDRLRIPQNDPEPVIWFDLLGMSPQCSFPEKKREMRNGDDCLEEDQLYRSIV